MHSDKDSYRTKTKFSDPLPIDNPEIPSKTDWWDDLCKAEGVKNHWKKNKKKNK